MLRLVSPQPLVSLLTLESGPLDDIRQTPGCGLACHSGGGGGVRQKAMPAALGCGKSDDSFEFQPQRRVRAEEGGPTAPVCDMRRGRAARTGTQGDSPSVASLLFTNDVC